MATIKEIVEDVYTGADQSHPYRSLKTPLSELRAIVSGKRNIFTDGTVENTLTAAITGYQDDVDDLLSTIDNLDSNLNDHYNDWWKANFGSDDFSSYKITPNVLLGADRTEKKIYEESNLTPKTVENTFFYKGRQTWGDDIGNLQSWIDTVQAEQGDIFTVVGGTVTESTPITTASGIINSTKSAISSINSTFNTLKGEERAAWDDAIRYVQAYAYASFLQKNTNDEYVGDLKEKFSSNLPQIPLDEATIGAIINNGDTNGSSTIELGELFSDVTINNPSSGEVLKWDGSTWVNSPSSGTGGGASVTISDTAPVSPGAGDLWFDSTTTQMYVYYNDGNSSQWVTVTSGSPSADAASITYTPAGTGAVATDVETKLRERVSVKDFGAVGDGVTDDTVAIQNAYTASQLVYVPEGSYLVDTNLTIPSSATFEFANGGKFIVGSGVTISWNGGIVAGDYQEIFSGDLVQSAFISNVEIPYTFGVQGDPNIKYSTPFWFGAAADFNSTTGIGTDDIDSFRCAQYFGKTTFIPASNYKIVGNINEKRSDTYLYGAGGSSKIYQRDTGTFGGTGALVNIGGNNGSGGVENTIIENIWVDCDSLTNENMVGIGSDAGNYVSKCKVEITGGNSGRSAATMQGNVTECYINVIAETAVSEAQPTTRYAGFIESTFATPSTIRGNKIDLVINDSVVNGVGFYDADDCEINFVCKEITGDPNLDGGTLVRLRGTGRGNKVTARAETISNSIVVSDSGQSDFVINAQCKTLQADVTQVIKPYDVDGTNGVVNILIQEQLDNGAGEISGTGIDAEITITANANTTLAPIDMIGTYCQVRPNVEGVLCDNGVILVRGTGNKVVGGFVTRGNTKKGVRILGTDSQCIGTTVIGDGIEAIRVESAAVRPSVTGNTLIGTAPTIVTLFSGSADGCIANNTNDTGTPSGKMMRFGSYAIWVDATGDMRLFDGTPTTDTDGTVIGTQS